MKKLKPTTSREYSYQDLMKAQKRIADMNIDREKIIEKLKDLKSDKKLVSLYISEKTYKRFRFYCQKASVSKVVEELMKIFSDEDDDEDFLT